MKRGLTLCTGLLLAATVAAQEGAKTAAEPPLAERIDEIFAEYDSTRSPGCALAVIADGATVHQRGYGMANLEHDLALHSRSVFRIASVSKQFTAAAIALLAEQGKLSLDDDVREHLPELAPHDPPPTLRQMIHHTSGLRDYLVLMWLAGADDADHYEVEEALAMLARQQELNFEPGSERLYSNAGYFLLSQVVERVSGQTLREFAQEHIFTPLGMEDTHFHDDHTEAVKNRADGYVADDDGGFSISMTTLDMVGDGGVFTTVEDLARWDANFYDNRLGKGGPELIEQLETPGEKADGYAFGLSVGEYRGLRSVRHGGAFVGFRTYMMRFPTEATSVICLCNLGSANPGRLARRVADAVLADRFPEEPREAPSAEEGAPAVELSEEELAGYTGLYFDEAAREALWIRLREGQLIVSRGDDETPLHALGDGRFRADRSRTEVRFTGGERAASLVVDRPNGEPSTFGAVVQAEYSADELAAFLGTYYSAELDTRYTLVETDGAIEVDKRGDDFTLTPAFADFFVGEDGYLGLEFTRDDAGAVTGFVLQAGRVRNLLFERL